MSVHFGGGPTPQNWYGTLDAITSRRLGPMPSVGRTITLDAVPEELDVARRSDGPPRVTVHPNETTA